MRGFVCKSAVLFWSLVLLLVTACAVVVSSRSFRVNLPSYIYSEKGWVYRCEVVQKPRLGGKMDCTLWEWQTLTPEPTLTPWVITATSLPATATMPEAMMTATPTITLTPPTPYP